VKRIYFILILLALVTFWYFVFYSREHPQKITPVPAVSDLRLYVQSEDRRSGIIDAIREAKREVLIETYLISDKQVIDALEEAHRKGVAVNVIIECHPFGGGNINKKVIEEFKLRKINNKCASDKYSLTHEKAIVIDEEKAFVMTQNLTLSSFEKNREYVIEDRDKKDVDEIRKIFLSDWEEKAFVPTLTNIIESPNNARAGITSLIESAKNEIDIEMEVIEDIQIINLLKAKARNMKINLILPTVKQIGANKNEMEELRASGVNVRTMGEPYMHAKMILVDLSTAFIGSVNLTSASIDENRELGIILSQQDVVGGLSGTFLTDWERAN